MLAYLRRRLLTAWSGDHPCDTPWCGRPIQTWVVTFCEEHRGTKED